MRKNEKVQFISLISSFVLFLDILQYNYMFSQTSLMIRNATTFAIIYLMGLPQIYII